MKIKRPSYEELCRRTAIWELHQLSLKQGCYPGDKTDLKKVFSIPSTHWEKCNKILITVLVQHGQYHMVFFSFWDLINFYITQIPSWCFRDSINSHEIQQFLLSFQPRKRQWSGTNLVNSRMKDKRKIRRNQQQGIYSKLRKLSLLIT